MNRSVLAALAVSVVALTACGTDDDLTETADAAEETASAEETETTESTPEPDEETQTPETADEPETAEPEQTTQAEDSDEPMSVEYVATAEGTAQVSAGFGNHEFEEFTDTWTDTEEIESGSMSMSVEADEGSAICEIIIDGETMAEEEDPNGSVYCAATVWE